MKRSRKNPRLAAFDYSAPGAYFITVCTQERRLLFGDIRNGVMVLNAAGVMIESWWKKLPSKFPAVEVDAHVVMPNHFHGIVKIVGADPSVRPGQSATDEPGAHMGAPLHTVVQWFKTIATNEYIRGVKQLGWPSFPGKLWQRNYYEHVIRNERELNLVREYIVNNPLQWSLDRENPDAKSRSCDAVLVDILGLDLP